MLELFPKAISIYKWGSCVVPYIKHPNDIDYLVIYEKYEDLIENDIPKQEDIDIHFFVVCLEDLKSKKYLELNKKSFYKEHKRCEALFQLSCSNVNLLMFKWTTLVEGKDLNLNQYFNIEYKENYTCLYLSLLKSSQNLVSEFYNTKEITKHWYYVCLGYYVFLNKSYQLNKDEIKLLNKFHDLKAKEDDCNLLYRKINRLILDNE